MERRNRPLRALTVLGLLGAVLFVALGSCRSLPKDELEVRLRALGKNAPITSLERLEFRADLGRGPEDLELVYHHAPAREATGATPVVLIHGTPSTLFTWVETIYGVDGTPGLAAQRDVWALEVIGHGIAPGGDPVDFQRCSRFVTAAIRALGIGPVHIVGQSYGGEFVWRAALDDPDSIASLVIMNSSGLVRREQDWLPEEVEMRENSLADIGWWINSQDRITTALEPHFKTVPPDRVEEFFLVCENASNWRSMIDLCQDENGDRQGELGQMSVPTLVLWGADDIAYVADFYGQGFADAIPGAELKLMEATGHYPQEERPLELVRILEEFFGRHEVAAGTAGGGAR